MQLDMHYYGTYALARLAGMRPDAAAIVATAAQFVDDHGQTRTIQLQSGGLVDAQATAHHPANLRDNLKSDDQRRVWVPFHFFPGGEGESALEKLACVRDGRLMNLALAHQMEHCAAPYALEFLGIMAHVYADTFSHYDFSGIASPLNEVDSDSMEARNLGEAIAKYVGETKAEFFAKQEAKKEALAAEGFWEKIGGWFAEGITGALGHAGVATWPDRPYLEWSFQRDGNGKTETRDNPITFLEGAKALHRHFGRFLEKRPDCRDAGGVSFEGKTVEAVLDVLNTQAPEAGRSQAWRDLLKSGSLTGRKEDIPTYDEAEWTDGIDELAQLSPAQVLESPAYRFLQASSIHRAYALRELFPENGIVIA